MKFLISKTGIMTAVNEPAKPPVPLQSYNPPVHHFGSENPALIRQPPVVTPPPPAPVMITEPAMPPPEVVEETTHPPPPPPEPPAAAEPAKMTTPENIAAVSQSIRASRTRTIGTIK